MNKYSLMVDSSFVDSMKINLNQINLVLKNNKGYIDSLNRCYQEKNVLLGKKQKKGLFDMNSIVFLYKYLSNISTQNDVDTLNDFVNKLNISGKQGPHQVLKEISERIQYGYDYEHNNDDVVLKEFLAHPGHILSTGIGDCDDFSTLALVTLSSLGYKDILIVSLLPKTFNSSGHALLAIPDDMYNADGDDIITFMYLGIRYILIEPQRGDVYTSVDMIKRDYCRWGMILTNEGREFKNLCIKNNDESK